MADRYTITLPLPDRRLSQNARVHWAVRAKATKAARLAAWAAACEAMKGARPAWAKARVQIEAWFKTATHPDPANLVADCKAYFDGLQDAGMIANDKGLWPDRPRIGKDKGRPRLELTIVAECD